ncbi:mogroside IE synthase-like isoform X2 [Mangifera indica]|uniref:mogroside IE synthase-like isoform X2 n=1 Tax=Mangifera indica TaxID=29780 RepID=UPI001CFA2847|nr:mogroside IE synthase-like isoform X2 [Mangifera indica]
MCEQWQMQSPCARASWNLKMTKMETQILVIPFPTQGHLNPMLQLSRRLASKGLKVTLVCTNSSLKSNSNISSIDFKFISDGFDSELNSETFDEYIRCLRAIFPQNLARFVESSKNLGCPFKFMVYDSGMPWMLDVARDLGMDGAPFFTQSCAVNAVYYHLNQGTLNLKAPDSEGCSVLLPSLPLMERKDLPTFVYETESHKSLRELILNKLVNIHEPNWILVNSFDKLEEEVVHWMSNHCRIKAVGPTVPSKYMDKRLENDTDYGLTLFKPKTDTCKTWLDLKELNSVVYVSFGSLAALAEEQMEEIAWGLKRSNTFFLWVVRESESAKLPKNFCEETVEKGLVVSWSPQLEVLAHKSVGCFMTHCGWNSTLEALSLGVPVVAMPQWTDQTTNAKYIEDVWQVGVRVRVNEKGIVTREEIEGCIREVMEGERSEDFRRNSEKWKQLAKEAVDEGGSSDKNLEEFVAAINVFKTRSNIDPMKGVMQTN